MDRDEAARLLSRMAREVPVEPAPLGRLVDAARRRRRRRLLTVALLTVALLLGALVLLALLGAFAR